jgi:prepilin-type N-terminal cleavage/methylation domain-containing protein
MREKVLMIFVSEFSAGKRVCVAERKRGFTLIELMLAVSLFSIVMMAAGTIMIGEIRNASRNQLNVDMQRDASLTMSTIGNKIRESYVDEDEIHLEYSGDQTTLYFSSSELNYVRYDQSDDTIILKLAGESAFELIDGQWEIRDFSVAKENSTWHVTLELRVPDTISTVVLDSNFLPRNTNPDE